MGYEVFVMCGLATNKGNPVYVSNRVASISVHIEDVLIFTEICSHR
jgi:hypothetical protein